MNAIPLIVMAGVILAAFIALYLGERQRANAVRELAGRSSLHYLGDALPISNVGWDAVPVGVEGLECNRRGATRGQNHSL